jgi:hypothetical protein
MRWTTEKSEFDFRQQKHFSLLFSVQIGYRVKPASYPMHIGTYFSGDKTAEA